MLHNYNVTLLSILKSMAHADMLKVEINLNVKFGYRETTSHLLIECHKANESS